MSEAQRRIVIFGEVLIDMIALEEGNLKDVKAFGRFPGGAPANVAVGLKRLGEDPILISKVGNDPLGDFLRESLEREGLRTDLILRSDNYHTGLVFVQLTGAKPEFFLYTPVAYNDIRYEEVMEKLEGIEGFQNVIFHVGTVTLVAEPTRSTQLKLMRELKERGSLISVDLNLRKDLWSGREEDLWRDVKEIVSLSDILKVSDSELMAIAENIYDLAGELLDIAERVKELSNLRALLVTAGERGSYLIGDITAFSKPFRVKKVVDTTGAGDAFTSALLKFLAHHDLSELISSEEMASLALDWANLVAATTVLKRGAWSVPKKEDLPLILRDEFLEEDLDRAMNILEALENGGRR